jgi:hypothetical protein
VFLVAVADALWRRGVDARRVVDRCVVGVDLDPGAVSASGAALRAWAEARGAGDVTPDVRVADGLASDLGPFDLVVGNPPFRSQLGAATARDATTAARRRERFGDAAGGYVDDAALFLLEAARSLRAGGVACLIQPQSVLSADHAAGARAAVVDGDRRIVAAWFPGEQVFEAMVDVWAPFVRAGDQGSDAVPLYGGRTAERVDGSAPAVEGSRWSGLGAARAVPRVELTSASRLGDVATATAGFRDEYYALLAHTTDEPPPGRKMRVVTTGMIDPGVCTWGAAGARFGKRTWAHPWLDVDALASGHPRVGGWVERLAVPKALVASQTRVLEAVADPDGDLVPVTPTIAVVPTEPGDLDLVVAALVSPPAAAWIRHRRAGSGLSASAVRVTAKDLLALPLPGDRRAWRRAAEALASGAGWEDHGEAMCAAYGIDRPGLLAWWLDALPRRSRSSATGLTP